MDVMYTLFMTFSCLMMLLMLRINIVTKTRLRAIGVIYAYKDWQEKKELLINPSYNEMVFDLTKWTFKQFYPELYIRETTLNETNRERR